MASATELVIAFVMGLGGTIFYALDGAVDIRLAMIILAGSLFGVQIGAIGTTYAEDHAMTLVLALVVGGLGVMWALIAGMAQHRKQHEALAAVDGIED